MHVIIKTKIASLQYLNAAYLLFYYCLIISSFDNGFYLWRKTNILIFFFRLLLSGSMRGPLYLMSVCTCAEVVEERVAPTLWSIHFFMQASLQVQYNLSSIQRERATKIMVMREI